MNVPIYIYFSQIKRQEENILNKFSFRYDIYSSVFIEEAEHLLDDLQCSQILVDSSYTFQVQPYSTQNFRQIFDRFSHIF